MHPAPIGWRDVSSSGIQARMREMVQTPREICLSAPWGGYPIVARFHQSRPLLHAHAASRRRVRPSNACVITRALRRRSCCRHGPCSPYRTRRRLCDLLAEREQDAERRRHVGGFTWVWSPSSYMTLLTLGWGTLRGSGLVLVSACCSVLAAHRAPADPPAALAACRHHRRAGRDGAAGCPYGAQHALGFWPADAPGMGVFALPRASLAHPDTPAG